MHVEITYLNAERMEGPANTSPLVDTITGSTTKADFKLLIVNFGATESATLKTVCCDNTAYLELDTP